MQCCLSIESYSSPTLIHLILTYACRRIRFQRILVMTAADRTVTPVSTTVMTTSVAATTCDCRHQKIVTNTVKITRIVVCTFALHITVTHCYYLLVDLFKGVYQTCGYTALH
jgi:hypothetical protein